MNVNAQIYGIEAIQQRLRAAAAALQNLQPMLDEIGGTIITQTQLRFQAGGPSPDGIPWKPLSAATIRSRRKGKGDTSKIQPLRDIGTLMNSIGKGSNKRIDGNSVWIGTNVAYAPVHQFGASAYHPPQSRMVRLRVVKGRTRFAKDSHKKARTVWGTNSTGWTVNIPARPYLGFSQDDQTEIIGIIQRRINEAGAA